MNGDVWAVEMEGLVKRFGSFVAVDHVTMQVRKGEISRVSGAERGWEIDRHPHAVRAADAHLGERARQRFSTWGPSLRKSAAASGTCRSGSRSTTI